MRKNINLRSPFVNWYVTRRDHSTFQRFPWFLCFCFCLFYFVLFCFYLCFYFSMMQDFRSHSWVFMDHGGYYGWSCLHVILVSDDLMMMLRENSDFWMLILCFFDTLLNSCIKSSNILVDSWGFSIISSASRGIVYHFLFLFVRKKNLIFHVCELEGVT